MPFLFLNNEAIRAAMRKVLPTLVGTLLLLGLAVSAKSCYETHMRKVHEVYRAEQSAAISVAQDRIHELEKQVQGDKAEVTRLQGVIDKRTKDLTAALKERDRADAEPLPGLPALPADTDPCFPKLQALAVAADARERVLDDQLRSERAATDSALAVIEPLKAQNLQLKGMNDHLLDIHTQDTAVIDAQQGIITSLNKDLKYADNSAFRWKVGGITLAAAATVYFVFKH